MKTTMGKAERGERLVAEEVFDGFDQTRYKDEVIHRWGEDAYKQSDAKWRSMSKLEKKAFLREQAKIVAEFARASSEGLDAGGDEAQAIVARHVKWLSTWKMPTKDYIIALGQLYVDDPRFGANYEIKGQGHAEYVRNAMKIYAERHLSDN